MKGTFNLEVSKTIYGNFIMWFLPTLVNTRLLTVNYGVKLANKFVLNDKTIKFRLNKGKWVPVDLSDYEIEVHSYE